VAVDEPARKGLGEGAAQAAPTAPHATPRALGGGRSGPELFWARWPVRVALALALVISGAAHCAVVPFDIPHGFEMKDVEGEAAIPIDLVEREDTPPAPPLEAPAEVKPRDEKAKESATSAPVRPDAGATYDAGLRDGSPPDAPDDARAADAGADAGAGGRELDAAVALAEAGGSSGPRDPEAIVGAAGAVQADVVLVMLVVNAEVIRSNPVGAGMGYLLRGIPQWDDFMSGTDIDPVRDTDWVMISGPSLVNTMRDVVLIHYSAPAAAVDRAVDIVTRKYPLGGPVDVGVPGVRASRVHADRAERIMLRAQPRVLAVVPPSVADKVARQLVASRVPSHVRPGEAVYLRLVNPHHPMPEIPEAITELRLRVVPRADAGADVFIDGDTKDVADAAAAAEVIRRVFRRHNDAITSLITHGLLDRVDVTAEGSLVKVHLVATRDQIQTLVVLVGEFLGVEPPQPPSPTAFPSSKRP
jgi:hypothetical protein